MKNGWRRRWAQGFPRVDSSDGYLRNFDAALEKREEPSILSA
jgi:hypothetical protein